MKVADIIIISVAVILFLVYTYTTFRDLIKHYKESDNYLIRQIHKNTICYFMDFKENYTKSYPGFKYKEHLITIRIEHIHNPVTIGAAIEEVLYINDNPVASIHRLGRKQKLVLNSEYDTSDLIEILKANKKEYDELRKTRPKVKGKPKPKPYE